MHFHTHTHTHTFTHSLTPASQTYMMYSWSKEFVSSSSCFYPTYLNCILGQKILMQLQTPTLLGSSHTFSLYQTRPYSSSFILIVSPQYKIFSISIIFIFISLIFSFFYSAYFSLLFTLFPFFCFFIIFFYRVNMIFCKPAVRWTL